MNDIVIIGCGGFSKEVLWIIDKINDIKPTWNVVGLINAFDNGLPIGTKIDRYQVIGNLDWIENRRIYTVFAIGDPIIKKRAFDKIKTEKLKYPILIHPNAVIATSSAIGEGSIICPGTVISVDTRIGNHVIVTYGCTIGHDTTINDYSTVFPGVNIAGRVIIEKCVSLGTGSRIIQDLSIGENAVIGAGAVVISHIQKNAVAVGVPAKEIKIKD